MGTYKRMARENILIIAHERGLNKTKGILKALKNKNCILFTDQPPNDFKTYVNNARQIIISHWFNIIDVISQVKHIDVIYCCSENLLPIQSQLEYYYNIKNLSPFAAEVLSNKQLFDDYCRTIGLENYVPKSITPKNFEDLNIFDINDTVFTKPDIGTGGNVFVKDVDYKKWNINDFKNDQGVGKIFELNREGLYRQRFNNKPCKMMVQKFLSCRNGVMAPYGFVADGYVNVIGYLRLEKSKIDISKDLKIWFVDNSEVDSNIHQKIKFFLNTLINSLNIKELFFVGPDFWMDGDDLIGIDFNPRNGQFVNNLDDINNNNIISSMIEGKLPQISNRYLSASANLVPGRIKSCVIDPKIKKFLHQENIKICSGMVIPKNQGIQNKDFQMNFDIGGSNEMELLSKYEEINNTLQSSIVYD